MIETISDIDIKKLLNLRKEISRNVKWGFNLSEKEFIKGMLYLNPQSYGARIENHIKKCLGFTKVSAKKNRGDLVNPCTKCYYEVKISLLTPCNLALNLVQIRLWQNVDYYLCVAYDLRNVINYRKYVFLLTHDEMKKECARASAAHGTSISNSNNKNVELRMSINCDENDETFKRWKEKYLKEDFNKVV